MDVQLPNTTDVVSLNLDQGEVYNIMWKSLSVTCNRSGFSSGPPVSSTNKTDRHDIAEIFLKVMLITMKQITKQKMYHVSNTMALA
jgi:hypothetical protein